VKGGHADPDGVQAALLLGLLGTAGMFYVNVLPAMVSGLRDALGYSNVQAGYVASANVYGAALGALCATFLVGRLPWKRVQAVTLALLALLDLLCTQVSDLSQLVVLRAMHGICGGISVGLALAVMARTRVPQRAYGAQFTLQVLLGGIGLIFLPELAAKHGIWVLFVSLAALALVTLLLLPRLADYRVGTAPGPAAAGARAGSLLVATLAALFMFQAANMAMYAFIIPLGHAYQLSTRFVSNTLGAADWLAALGSLLAMWIGVRFGRTRPLLLALLVTVPATAAFVRSDLGAVFIAANVLTGIVWAFVVPCLFGMCAALDPSGRSASLGGFFSKLGLASGPLLAPFIIGADRYAHLVWAAVAGLALVLLLGVWPARRIDRPVLAADH
jgi:MFS transporter, DHA1 family, inner membrane transport protein